MRLPRLSLAEEITDDLRERIMSGELAAGQTIRQEHLAQEYDVSRMPIRDALSRLDAEGLVTFTAGRGARVAALSPHDVAELFDLRALIEVDLFRRAIPAMTPEDFDQCNAILEQMEASFDRDDVAQWGKLNHRFHMSLYAAADRKRSEEILVALSLHADRFVRIHLGLMEQRAPAKQEHRQLLTLAEAGDFEAAALALCHHIQRTKGQLLEFLSKAD